MAAAPDTTVLITGAKPGAALPVSPYEYWYAAEPYYRSGDYARAVEIASEGLADHADNPSLRYQLACYEALAGHTDAAVGHLRIAYANNPETREWAAGDDDLASVRDLSKEPVKETDTPAAVDPRRRIATRDRQ